MMTRNLNRRVEILFPILENDLHDRVLSMFYTLWNDNVKTRILHDQKYRRINRRNQAPRSAQHIFMLEANEAKQRDQAYKVQQQTQTFKPLTNHNQTNFFGGK